MNLAAGFWALSSSSFSTTPGVPNRTAILQDWTHKSFVSCFFYILWTRIQVLSKYSKGPVRKRVFHLKSFVIDIPRHLMPSFFSGLLTSLSTIFQSYHDCSEVYEAWIFSGPFSCQLHHIEFDRLKSYIPLPCPTSQTINIFLKCQYVLYILNFRIANTASCRCWLGTAFFIICILFFFLFGFYDPSRLLHSFWAKSIIRWMKMGDPREKTPDHLQAELRSSRVTPARLEPTAVK